MWGAQLTLAWVVVLLLAWAGMLGLTLEAVMCIVHHAGRGGGALADPVGGHTVTGTHTGLG